VVHATFADLRAIDVVTGKFESGIQHKTNREWELHNG
jgi:hypothetical protein